MPERNYKEEYYSLLDKYSVVLEERIKEHAEYENVIKTLLGQIDQRLNKAESMDTLNIASNKANTGLLSALLTKLNLMSEQEVFDLASSIRNEVHALWLSKSNNDDLLPDSASIGR